MNLLIITKNYPPVMCGVGDHTANLVREFGNMGFKVTVFTETREAAGKEEVIVSEKPFGYAIAAQLQQVITAKQITTVLWQYVPYSYQVKGLPFWWPRAMAGIKKMNIRQFIFFHEVSLRYWTDGLQQTIIAFLQRNIARRANRIAHGSITSITLYRSYFRDHFPQVVPVGSNLPEPGKDIRVKAGSIFSFANRVDETLVKAVAAVAKETGLEWVIGGHAGKQLKQQLEAHMLRYGLAEQCRITGPLPAQQLSDELAAAAIVLLPQRVTKYGQGGVSAKNGTVMAAMQMGKAIISCSGDMTDSGFFMHGHNIHLSAAGDVASALQYCMEHSAYAQQLGSNARQSFEQHCSWGEDRFTADRPYLAVRLVRETSAVVLSNTVVRKGLLLSFVPHSLAMTVCSCLSNLYNTTRIGSPLIRTSFPSHHDYFPFLLARKEQHSQ